MGEDGPLAYFEGDGTVVKTDWGLKRICPQCGTRYYDKKKNPPVCPSCSTVFDPETLLKSRSRRVTAEEKAARKAAVTAAVIDDLPLVEGDEPEENVIEDADELEDVDVEEVVDLASDED